jgi:hypothetical protein
MQTFTAKQYLQIDIASNFGLDKKTWDERLAWFAQHQDNLLEMLPQAKEPALYYAGVQAWNQVLLGQPIGYPISLDATSSGLQLLAALTGDRSAAELCNVVNSPMGNRADAYMAIYTFMMEILGENSKIDREDVKRAIMTALYGSQAVPKEVFGEGELFNTFIETMQEHAPAAWEIWDAEALTNDWVLPDNFHVHIKVMAGVTETMNFLNKPYEVTRKVNMPTKGGRSLGANTIHSVDGMIVREMTRRCSYDPSWIQLIRDLLVGDVESRFTTEAESQEAHQMVETLWGHYETSGYLSARILDHLDSDTLQLVDARVIQELVDSLPARPFDIITIHDCFRCLPNYGNDLRKQYALQLHLIARSNLLGFLFSQLLKHEVRIGKLDPTLADDILETNYALS